MPYSYMLLCLLLFIRGRLSLSMSICVSCFRFLLTFPLTSGPIFVIVPMVKRVMLFFMNSSAVGLSFRLPLPLCWPKYSSSGSCENLSLSKNLTPGSLRSFLSISTNEYTVKGEGIKIDFLDEGHHNTMTSKVCT